MKKIIYKIRQSKILLNMLALLILFSSLFIECKKVSFTEKQNTNLFIHSTYNEVNSKIQKKSENNDTIVYEILTSEIKSVLLILNKKEGTSFIDINGNKASTSFNFEYNISLNESLSQIRIFKSDNSFLFFIPTVSEEYMTFEILKLDISKQKFYSSFFELSTHVVDDMPVFYKKSKIIIEEKDKKYKLKIGTLEFISSSQDKVSFSNITSLKNNTAPNKKQLSGLWSVNCSPAERNIDIKESSVVISMETNQYYITLKELKREKNKIYYQYEKMSGLGAQDYDSPAYSNSEMVCTIEIVNDELLKFSWLGLYDKELKERFEKENPFNQYEKTVSLKKCPD